VRICLKFLLFVCLLTAAGWAHPSYQVHLTSLDRIHVDATFDALPEETLFMETGASGRDDGFSSFVQNLSGRSADGSPLSLHRKGAEWKLGGPVQMPVQVSYDVDLSFARSPWPVGNEQAGYGDDRTTYVVSKALFLDCKQPGQRTIRFLPHANWKIAAPWKAEGDAYIASSSDDLLRNVVVFGQFTSVSAQAGPFSFQIVAFGKTADQQNAVSAGLAAAVRQSVGMFPGTPLTHYLVVLIPGAEDDGESFLTSFASTLKVPLETWERIVWLNTIAHELTHFWIGGLISTGDDMEWFDEGFTEYYANLSLVRSEAITPEQFVQKMERHLAAYSYFMSSPLFSGVSVQGAGKRKGSYRFGVYDAGWTIAWVLDLKIRETSHNEKSLDSLMTSIFLQAMQTRAPVSLQQFTTTLATFLGPDGNAFVQQFIAARNDIDFAPLLDRLGLEAVGQSYAGELYMRVKEQSELRSSWANF
jgi:predicted metalloprotease with PDZ domain